MQAMHGPYVVDDALARFDFERCHRWLTETYWSPGITQREVEHGFRHSTIVAGAYDDGGQVACLRVASDRTRFAYLMDVFVDPEHRGRGLGRALVRFVVEHPDLALVYNWTLATNDAHGVYRAVGFTELTTPERHMVLARPRPWMADEVDETA